MGISALQSQLTSANSFSHASSSLNNSSQHANQPKQPIKQQTSQ
jgi:hypothetical protein